MDNPAIALFLPTDQQLQEALTDRSSFRDFLALVEKSSGEDPQKLDLAKAVYRIADAANGIRERLTVRDTVRTASGEREIGDLIATSTGTARDRLAYSVWALPSFEGVKLWLKGMQALVRYGHDLDGQLVGHLMLAESVVPMVETVERRNYVLANGDMASDAITRNLGLRAKVFTLDRARRAEKAEESLIDRLSRTLSRINR